MIPDFNTSAPDADYAQTLLQDFTTAKQDRQPWESLWQDCYDYALPMRIAQDGVQRSWRQAYQMLFDATATDAVDQLASVLLAQLVPPWSPWVQISAGPNVSDADKAKIDPALQRVNRLLFDHFRHSNFTVALHQALLDMVTVGTACLRFDETLPGSLSAFTFQAVPLRDFYVRGDDLRSLFMPLSLTVKQLRQQCPGIVLPDTLNDHDQLDILYSLSYDGLAFTHDVVYRPAHNAPMVVWRDISAHSPFMAFRWQKIVGESYGRSPVMKALPDIKTANKVVELILKNASIAVTGIWQADDDGVLNPANIKLTPGTIIPKAVGSAGLTPLKMPGNFDISQLVLNDLRTRIKQALLTDKITPPDQKRMTATEILERSADMARLLGAVYSRLQGELLCRWWNGL